VADYFEASLAVLERESGEPKRELAKPVSNWVMTDILRVLGEQKVAPGRLAITPARLAALISLVRSGMISGKMAKEVFAEMLASEGDPRSIVERRGLAQVSEGGALERAVEAVIQGNASQVRKYLDGHEKVFGYLVGEAMKATAGKANPKLLNEALRKKLEAMKG
jgi:aspartyl-tRNA(Asn)/glutamyl-tRNA(Gln) amidotransferase subunit B